MQRQIGGGYHRVSGSTAALMLVDVINDLEYPGGDQLLGPARSMAERTAALKRRARQRGAPVIYLNELEERFKPSFSRHVAQCLQDHVRGKPVVELLRPEKDDFFVLCPAQSSAALVTLDTMFQALRISTLIFAGMTKNLCTLLAANDLYLSGFRLLVPDDCVASPSEADKHHSLEQMRTALGVDTRPSTELEPLLDR